MRTKRGVASKATPAGRGIWRRVATGGLPGRRIPAPNIGNVESARVSASKVGRGKGHAHFLCRLLPLLSPHDPSAWINSWIFFLSVVNRSPFSCRCEAWRVCHNAGLYRFRHLFNGDNIHKIKIAISASRTSGTKLGKI